jgi:ribosome-binding factor A
MERKEKLNFQIRRVISELIQEEIDDPEIGIISLTHVELSSDLRQCKVFISVFPEENTDHVRSVLNKMKGYLRSQLGARVRMKFTPELKFLSDTVIKESVDVSQKLEELKHEVDESSRAAEE